MKVVKSFFCIQEKKTYKVGDEYTGNRTDLGALLEQVEDKQLKPKIERKKRKK